MSAAATETVSIVTISYNQVRFVDECLDSVLAERRPGRDDYVVIDPGSTDGSRERIAARAHAIDTVLFEPDRGPADGLNKGFARARGTIFGYINSDDRLAPGAIGYVTDWFRRHPDVDVLCGAVAIVDEHGRTSLRRRVSDEFDIARYIAGVCTIGQQATFIRRAAFERTGGFNVANRVSWDGELLVDLALAGARFASTARVLGDWRIYAGTITGSSEHRARLDAEMRRIAERLEARGYPLYPPAACERLRLRYKYDPVRHFRYLVAR
jgi:glycosyltransferase involved in cell wall biosynthesis